MSLIKTKILEPLLEANNYELKPEYYEQWSGRSEIPLTPEEQAIGAFEWGKEAVKLPEWESFSDPRECN